MFPRCEGRGSVSDIDLSALYDDTKSINEGAITIPGYSMRVQPDRRYPEASASGSSRRRTLGEQGGVYVVDEPTTGLHLADVEQLLGLLDQLVDSGKSVIVIEHDQAVMAHADWIIDLGPGAGHDRGRVVFEGTPADLVADGSTLTGEHLAAYAAG